MKGPLRLALTADFHDARLLLAEISALAKVSEAAAEYFNRLIRLAESGLELFVFEADHGAATVAGKLLVVAKPSDGLLRAMAAARAGNFDLGVLEDAFGHVASPSDVTGRAGAGLTPGSRTDRKPTPIPGTVEKGGAR